MKNKQNVGDNWTDFMVSENIKVVEKYTYKSFEKGIAIVEVNASNTMTQKIVATEDDEDKVPKKVSVYFTTVYTMQVDVATLLTKKRSLTTT